jgi:hypothetical protein
MKYMLKRGEETYGPYSLADLQKYVQSGNIALTDLTQSEGMADWAPISQVIGTVQVPVAPVYGMPAASVYGTQAAPVYGMPVAPNPGVESVPLPPNLHWVLLLVIDVVTRSFFSWIWVLIQANWARKLDGDNSTLMITVTYPAAAVAAFITLAWAGMNDSGTAGMIGLLLGLAGLIANTIGAFKVKSAMEAYYNFNENIGLSLNGVMIFFFGSIYIQFHVNRIAKWKSTGILE